MSRLNMVTGLILLLTTVACNEEVVNTPPVLADVSLSPDPAFETDTLTCTPGTVTDIDGTTAFVYSYAWSVNGEVLTATAATLIGIDFDRDDNVYCTVTPNDGTDDGTTVTSNVLTINNSPPTLTEVAIYPESAVASDTLTCNATGAFDADGDETTVRYEWTVDDELIGSDQSLSGLFQGEDVVSCSAFVDDGTTTGISLSTAITIENTAPVLDSVTLGPDQAFEDETVVCTPGLTSDDDETEAFSYTFSWTVDAVPVAATDDTLTGEYFDRDDSITCTVVPNDGTEDGAAVTSNTITIANSPPTIKTVTITPEEANASDTLLCNYEGFLDKDEDADFSTIAWTINGNPAGKASTLASGFVGGDGVTCTITPDDGTLTGTPKSATIIIENSAPSISSVTITPDPALAGDSLNCSYSGFLDVDGDADSSSIEWFVNSIPAGTGPELIGSMVGSDVVECTVTPNDGTATGTPKSDSLTIGNTVPVLTEISLSPDPASESDTLVCAVGAVTDADGDTTTTTYTWNVNSGIVPVTANTLTGTYFDKEDNVYCSATPSDGTDNGTTILSNTVTIQNTAPEITDVTITPNSSYVTDVLNCSWSGWSDIDGDTDQSVLNWTINGVDSGTDDVLMSGFVGGDVVTCTVTAFDGTDSGTVSVATINITNSPPSITSVNITPNPAYAGENLVCDYSGFSDLDGDGDTSALEWWVNGSFVGTTSTLSTALVHNDTVECIVTPMDGTDTGTALSDTIIITNTLPQVFGVTLSPAYPDTVETVTASVLNTDADGESVTLDYDWYVDGSLVAESGPTLDGFVYFDKHEDIYVVVTPNDGNADGVAITSEPVFVVNTAPQAPITSITPETPKEGIDDLVCGVDVGSYDLDGDFITYSFEWEVDGVFANTGDTVSRSDTNVGETWTCTVTPDDGEEDGSPVSTSVQVRLSGQPDVQRIATGEGYVCGLDLTGEVHCTGNHFYNYDSTPPPSGPFTQIDAAEDGPACGLHADGVVECWGNANWYGPTESFTQIASSWNHNCATDTSGLLSCAAHPARSYLLNHVPSGYYPTQISGSHQGTCGLDEDGSAYCWTGGGTFESLGPYVQISAGDGFACGLDDSGTITCFNGGPSAPVGTYTSISAGYAHICAIDTAGSIVCEGLTVVPDDNIYIQLDSNNNITCGLTTEENIHCWGGLSGELIDMPMLGCADGTVEGGVGVWNRDDIVLCESTGGGKVDLGEADELCADDWHVCSSEEFITRNDTCESDDLFWAILDDTDCCVDHRNESESGFNCQLDGDRNGSCSSTGSGSWGMQGCGYDSYGTHGTLCCSDPAPLDGDGDGVAAAIDCDDSDPNIYPYAGDVYGDGIDSDCDGIDCEAAWSTDGLTYFAACTNPSTSWAEMDTICSNASHDGMASIQNEVENTDISNLIADAGMRFGQIGGSDEDLDGNWDWFDESPFSYSNFDPSHFSGSEQCVELDSSAPSGANGWNDCSCGSGGSDGLMVCQTRVDSDDDGVAAAIDCDDSDPDIGVECPGSPEIADGLNCLDILNSGGSTGNGTYWIDPDGTGAFEAYCDMTTQGGGWTMVFKQSDFDSAITVTDATYAGNSLLLNESPDGTTQGSIVGLVPHTDTLFKHDPSNWVHVEESILDWTTIVYSSVTNERVCRNLDGATHTCSGIDCASYKHIYMDRSSPPNNGGDSSSLVIGEYVSDYLGWTECGEVWYNDANMHGRHDEKGSFGFGDWMMFVR